MKGTFHSEPVYYRWLLLVVTIISVASRLYRIEEPSLICWDETHFGKMGSYYINRTFFHDVHPPLGKMLIGMAGILTGYQGNFSFAKPGMPYEENGVHYVGMRVFCALLGSALIPMSYITVWELSRSITACVLTAILMICDTGFLTISQYILLDPIMMFFITLSVMASVKFYKHRTAPFSIHWWVWLSITGVGLGGAIGVKFVGLFTVLLIGLSTAADLWTLLGDLSMSLMDIVKHFLARTLCLIAIPVVLYLAFFAVHFHLLKLSGPGDGFFSSWLQSTLEGNALHKATMPEEVMYGSVITIKQYRTSGPYLHSHWHLYPEGFGAKQQQVTTYSHKDDNNMWLVKKGYGQNLNLDSVLEPLKHGDIILLEHTATKRNLHSHPISAPLTKKHNQVTCYGVNGTGDSNDLFRVEIDGGKTGDPVKALSTVFRLVHQNIGCALYSHQKQLPKWGWEQMEVTCNPSTWDKNNRWTVEQVIDSRLPNVSFDLHRPGFMSKLIESHQVMFQSNAGLKPKEEEVTSRPWQWPINYRGQPFCGPHYRVLLLGNPIIWWLNVAAIVYYFILTMYHHLQQNRGKCGLQLARRNHVVSSCTWLMIGWLLHYAPFWAMSRVLYFHHYFPAAIFNLMLTGIVLSDILHSISGSFTLSNAFYVHHFLLSVLVSWIVYSFYLFHPLSYGMTGPTSHTVDGMMHGLRWLDSWDF